VYKEYLSPIEDVIEDARNGKMFILVDAEERENEGDLVIPAQMCTPEAVNFMAKYGRGLICLTLTGERSKQLNLQLMSSTNQSRHQTAFTVSIEAREGISTGISAHDRAHTVSVAIDPTKGATDIVSPGHVFPLVARDGGVLVRAGHTEAAVDISRLAGLYPAGVICEIMNDDGTMARLPDLVQFAQLHGLKIATIADLIAYRRRYDNFIHRAIETELDSDFGGEFKLMVYLNTVEYAEHIALVKGDISGPEPVLVRVHAMNVFDDILGATGPRSDILKDSMRIVSDMLLRKGESGDHEMPRRLREYGVGAQILLDLGIHDMVLLSDTDRSIVGLEGYGLRVVGQRPLRDAAGAKARAKETTS
jgi:3,4-dihydroxy 2-butanone 4-phosphate synthase/GTP cyclohydrolase II